MLSTTLVSYLFGLRLVTFTAAREYTGREWVHATAEEGAVPNCNPKPHLNPGEIILRVLIGNFVVSFQYYYSNKVVYTDY